MWNGEGFPPVGTVCKFNYLGSWYKGTVIKVTESLCRARLDNCLIDFVFSNPNDIRPIKTEWDGEGFPPAGTYCDVKYRNKWIQCFIVGMDDLGNCVARNDSVYIATQLTENFRPSRTKREIAIEDMRAIIGDGDLGALYDAGYRK